jgi:hypothetical protein
MPEYFTYKSLRLKILRTLLCPRLPPIIKNEYFRKMGKKKSETVSRGGNARHLHESRLRGALSNLSVGEDVARPVSSRVVAARVVAAR